MAVSTGTVIALIKALGSPDPAVIESAVSDWLDDHPEATTTVEDGSITKAKLDSDLQGTVDDVSDLKDTTNALNETVNGVITKNYTEGKTFSANSTSYSINDSENSCISDYIPATWGSEDKLGFGYTDDTTDATVYQILFFDSSKNYLGCFVRNATGNNYRNNLTPKTGTAYVRISFKKGYAGYVFKSGAAATRYYTATSTLTTAGHEQKIGNLNNLETDEKSSLVGAVNEVYGHLPINPADTTFFYISKNLSDPDKRVAGEFVNQTTGAFQSNSTHNRTGYIEIKPSTTYVLRHRDGSKDFRYAFYTSAKTYISGAMLASSNDMLITSPANARYVAFSNNTAPTFWMLAEYLDSDKSYESFDATHLLNKYIQEELSDLIINVPSKVYALVGYELNIYFENITEDWTKYHWSVTCLKGEQLERGYRITPEAGDEGEYALTIRAYVSDTLYKEVSTTLVVSGTSAGSGSSASVIILGDSTTDNDHVSTKLLTNFSEDAMTVTTLGTRGTSPSNHEGRSGWKWADYFTKASIVYPSPDPRETVNNPFYNPTSQTFDAGYYFTNSGVSEPDWFFINLGINDVFSYVTDVNLNSGMTTILDRCEAAVESILDATSATKVGICLTIPCNHSQDAFGKAYSCSQTRDRCKRNNTLWVKKLIETFDEREDERIYIIPINASLDTVYNMGMETLPVNARNTDVTYESPISNGGVHPVTSGYWQIVDVYTAFLKANA